MLHKKEKTATKICTTAIFLNLNSISLCSAGQYRKTLKPEALRGKKFLDIGYFVDFFVEILATIIICCD